MARKTVIIGGVAGGATAAARLRRRDEERDIILLERGPYISYANCGLPYYVGGVIGDRDALLVTKPETMRERFRVDVRVQNEALSIDPEKKTLQIKDGTTGRIYEESYDDLVLATGSSPIKPKLPGIDSEGIFTVWTVPDTDRIRAYIQEHNTRKAVVVGGGFIGLEMAENLHGLGMEVTVMDMADQVMVPLDVDMANLIHENLVMNGVKLSLNTGVAGFRREGNQIIVETASGGTINTDLVVLSIGTRPNSQLAAGAGLKLGEKGGIVVDEYLRTSVPDIYAVGDVIEVKHFITGKQTMIPLAGPANRQARLLADNLAGDRKAYRGTMGNSGEKVFDYIVASTGLNEKQLQASGLKKDKDYFVALINQKSHAGYYPEATPLTLKMTFGPEGQIFGGQIIGQDGVDKRIDTLSTAIGFHGSVFDLAQMELAYSPPFSSAKDPVNMLGFVAENILNGMVKFIDYTELDQKMKKDPSGKEFTILDITEEMEHMVFSLPGSVNIPLGALRDRLRELDPEKTTVVYCAIGVRSYTASRILLQHGFKNVLVLAGGTAFYKSMHYRKETGIDLNQAALNGNGGASAGSAGSGAVADSNAVPGSPAAGGPGSGAEAEEEIHFLDCCGLQCPGPIMKVNQVLADMKPNSVLKVAATDMGFAVDIDSWCRKTGNTLEKTQRQGKENIAYIRKGEAGSNGSSDASCGLSQTSVAGTAAGQGSMAAAPAAAQGGAADHKTLIVFSNDLDRVLASFILANAAASMGTQVTMFFTFWGLNVLRKKGGVKVKKSMIEKMFGAMMPKGPGKLSLSKMNMGGMGTRMMKKVMRDKNVYSLEELIAQAQAAGVKFIACTMSMDIMGIHREELIDGIGYAGAATYLTHADEGNVNMFI